MGVLYWKRHRRGRSFGPRRRGGLPVDTPQLDGATPLCVAAPRKNETRSPGDIAAKSRSSQDVEVPPLKCAIPCGGCCGPLLGRGGPGGPSSSPAAAPPRPRQLFTLGSGSLQIDASDFTNPITFNLQIKSSIRAEMCKLCKSACKLCNDRVPL